MSPSRGNETRLRQGRTPRPGRHQPSLTGCPSASPGPLSCHPWRSFVGTISGQRNNQFARSLFNGVAGSYLGPARLYSFWQYQRWHRFLVSRLGNLDGKLVLDMSTGTGLVAAHIAWNWKAQVVGVDLSLGMLREAQQTFSRQDMAGDISLVLGRAESPPFAQGSFDAVIFTYLLRYVEDVPSVISQLAGLLKPGGIMASLEFAVPGPIWFRAPWLAYTHLAMPISMRLISPSWSRVGRFLGPSIRRLYRRYPQEQQLELWRQSGMQDVKAKSLSLGAALVTWGTKSPTA